MQKVACVECGVMILPQTAQANSGMCAQCGSLLPEALQFRRDRQRRMASGEAFRPDAEELATAIDIHAHLPTAIDWLLQPDFYADRGITRVDQALARAEESRGDSVFLCSSEGHELEFAQTAMYAVLVVTLVGEEFSGTYYADTPQNLREQVPEDMQATNGCSCCGVGIRRFASRFHMPRALGIEVFRAFLRRQDAPSTRWLEVPEIFFDNRDSD